MLEYCVCPKCARMIMLDSEFDSGFCCYCGTHILYSEAREELLEGLREAIPDEYVLEADLSELIDEDDAYESTYGLDECKKERDAAQEFLGKWDFSGAFQAFSRALDWYPNDFESRCGLMISGILRIRDTENWESYLDECTAQIRSQSDWKMAGAALEYALDILKRFLSKGGRFVSPSYTVGFFEKLAAGFPELKLTAAQILAHCLNVENAPFTDAARLDHETTQFAVGSRPSESGARMAPDKNLSRGMLFVLRNHSDMRVKESLCRALFVYERAVWLRARDSARIGDALRLCEAVTSGEFPPDDVRCVLNAMYDFLMMGGLEKNSTEHEKILFLATVYDYRQMREMERFFSSYAFFWKLLGEVYLKQRGASIISAEYKKIQAKINQLSG